MPETLANQTGLLWKFASSALILLIAYFAYFFLRRAVEFVAKRANLPKGALPPLHLLLRVGVVLFAAAMVANVFNYNILTGLVTIAGLVAIGFVAVWSVLSNVLCTFVLMIFKPFSVGDDLEFPADQMSGRVVDVSLIFTTLKTPDEAFVQIPNNMFFQRMFKRRHGATSIDIEHQLGQEKPAE